MGNLEGRLIPVIIRFWISCILLFSCNLIAQKSHVIYTTKDGLPHNTVTCTYKDKEGYLWIGTYGGLSRFDGSHFLNLPIGDFNSNQLAADIVLDIEEKDDKIWIAHSFGLSALDKLTLESKNYVLPGTENYYVLKNAVHDIYIDSENKMWLGSGQGLFFFNDREKKIEAIKYESADGKKISNSIFKIIPLPQDKLLLFAGVDYFTYDIKAKQFDTNMIENIPIEYIRGYNIRVHRLWNSYQPEHSVFIDRATKTLKISKDLHKGSIPNVYNIYVNQMDEIYIHTIKNTEIISLSNVTHPLPDFPTNVIHFNNMDDALLVGTFDGLYVITDNKSMPYHIDIKQTFKKNGVDISGINNCAPYHQNEVILSSKKGLHFFDYQSNLTRSSSFWRDSIINLSYTLSPQKIYVTTNDGVYSYNPISDKCHKIQPLQSYVVVIRKWNGKLIFGTRRHGLFVVNIDNDKVSKFQIVSKTVLPRKLKRVTDIIPSFKPNEFIVTYNDTSLYAVINLKSNEAFTVNIPTFNYNRKESFPLQTACLVDTSIWIGSFFGGILVPSGKPFIWKNITTSQGLYHDAIYQLMYDGNKYIWALTRGGINLIDKNSLSIKKFSNQLNTLDRPTMFKDTTGKIFICDNTSLYIINTKQFSLVQERTQILIGRIWQGEKNLKTKDKRLILPYYQNDLSIEFSHFQLGNKDLYQYAYRLHHNDNWISLGKQTQLNLNNMVPGEYYLQIKATDIYDEMAELSDVIYIKVKPPYWQTWWFRIMLFLTFVWLGWYINVMYIKNKLEKQKLIVDKQLAAQLEREKLMADLHDDIGASLSSIHINSEIAEKIQESKPENVKKLLGNISKESKEISAKLSDFLWSIKQESNDVVHIKSRILDFQSQLIGEKNIRFKYDIDEESIMNDLTFTKNLLLIIKESLNNISKYSGATEVNLTIKKASDVLILKIMDNGYGFDISSVSVGNGLNNMKKRCEDNGGTFFVTTQLQHGTTITCEWQMQNFHPTRPKHKLL